MPGALSMYYRIWRIFLGVVHGLAHQDVITYVAASTSDHDLKFNQIEIESI